MCAASVYPEPGSNSLVNGIYSSHISMLPIYLFLSYLALYFADHFFIDSLLLSLLLVSFLKGLLFTFQCTFLCCYPFRCNVFYCTTLCLKCQHFFESFLTFLFECKIIN